MDAMKIVMSKKKKYLVLLFVTLVLAAFTAGIYLFVNNHGSESVVSYNTDKYSNVTNWCDVSVDNNELRVDCKALLLDITTQEDGSSCFETQIITNEKESNNLAVCEKGDTLAYTNEVLGYKTFMPIDMVFTYNKKSLSNNYSFKNVSFTKLDGNYIQGLVNEDIVTLVTLDPKNTTIENSVDFCPKPETLPSYVTETNKQAYTEFFNKNIMAKEKYTDKYMYNWDDSIIRILFACDSAENMEYTDICNKSKVQGLDKITNNIPALTVVPDWNKATMDTKDEALLKEISLIYDSMFLKKQPNNITNLGLLEDLMNTINSSSNINEEVFCDLRNLYAALMKNAPIFARDENFIVENVTINYKNVHSPACFAIMNNNFVDQNGLALLYPQNNQNIIGACINLNRIIR